MAVRSGAVAAPLTSAGRAKPFIKWAGGKTQLLPELLARLPRRFNRYHEPFLGGAALFLRVQPRRAHLSDINPDLINAYTIVRDEVDALIATLAKHVYDEDYYYTIRDADRSSSYKRWRPARKAARLIYLNKSCFNGLYRVNAAGHFNVPFGRYVNPTLVDEENLRACSDALSGAKISVMPFDEVRDRAARGDFVYFDPPYAPLNATSNFTSYSSGGFDDQQQLLLRDTCVALHKKGVKFMVSNSAAPLILKLYSKFNIEFVKAARAINSKAEGRGKIREVIVRNYR